MRQDFRWGTLLLMLAVMLTVGVDCRLVQAQNIIPTVPVDSWEVEGMHGDFEVEGSLTESPCHLAMASEEQSIDLGTIPRYRFTHIGDHSPTVAVHLKLEDCGMTTNYIRDDNHENSKYQLPDQLVSLMTVSGKTAKEAPHLLEVQGGTSGVALRLEDAEHRQLFPGEHSRGLVMQQGNTDLVLYAMLERTALPLKEGKFNILVNFTLGYH